MKDHHPMTERGEECAAVRRETIHRQAAGPAARLAGDPPTAEFMADWDRLAADAFVGVTSPVSERRIVWEDGWHPPESERGRWESLVLQDLDGMQACGWKPSALRFHSICPRGYWRGPHIHVCGREGSDALYCRYDPGPAFSIGDLPRAARRPILMESEARLAKFVALAHERHPGCEVWLFGSRARGEARRNSDWDFFLILPDDAAPGAEDDLQELWKIGHGADLAADVVACRRGDFDDFKGTRNTLAYVVAREGVRLDG
jgi:predicted nucleotidyltransferase